MDFYLGKSWLKFWDSLNGIINITQTLYFYTFVVVSYNRHIINEGKIVKTQRFKKRDRKIWSQIQKKILYNFFISKA